MSNPSLKDQLQALSLASPKKSPQSANRSNESPTKQQKPAWLEYIQYGVELLKAHYPACFKENNEIKPIKIGIKQDLVKQLGTREDIVIGDKACMIKSLSFYVNSSHYYKSMTEGTVRVDLEGNAAGIVTAEEARYSMERSQEKLQKKKNTQMKKEVKQTESQSA